VTNHPKKKTPYLHGTMRDLVTLTKQEQSTPLKGSMSKLVTEAKRSD